MRDTARSKHASKRECARQARRAERASSSIDERADAFRVGTSPAPGLRRNPSNNEAKRKKPQREREPSDENERLDRRAALGRREGKPLTQPSQP